MSEEEKEIQIECEWLNNRRYITDADGQVIPCCYLANPLYIMKHTSQPYMEPVLREYLERAKELNIFENSLEDIFLNEWYTKILPESWDDPERRLWACKTFCSKCKK